MPLTFILLGLVLIFKLFFETNKIQKTWVCVFCAFAMFGFIVPPLYLKTFSVNVCLIVGSLGLLLFFIKSLPKLKVLNIVLQSLFILICYIALAKYNSDFITTLNPYPVLVILLIFNLLNLKNLNGIVCLNCLTFLLVSLSNLTVEVGLGYVHVASYEFFNLIGAIVFVVVVIHFALKQTKILKEKKHENRFKQK